MERHSEWEPRYIVREEGKRKQMRTKIERRAMAYEENLQEREGIMGKEMLERD